MKIKLKCYFCDKDLDIKKKNWGKADITHAAWIDKNNNICEPTPDYESDTEFYKYICCNDCHTNYVFRGRIYRLILDKRRLKHLDIPEGRAYRILKRGKICK